MPGARHDGCAWPVIEAVLAATQRVRGVFVVVAARPAGCLRWPAYTALHQLAHAVVVQGITEVGRVLCF
ncbi:hypothetical protein ACDW_19150 [Acidovorax sp. DW039]|nr:hypothetical protein ACDW_19150 [Acidovorax sp. DW039]